MTKEQKVQSIIKKLATYYPNARTALNYSKPHELLFATILSAQATDKSVNLVTPALFEKYKSIADFANADPIELNNMVKKINFHNNKSKNIQATAKVMVDEFGGEVPKNIKDLVSLPGVARKTANVVLGNAYGVAEGIVVDTHVMRLTIKLGLTDKKDPVKIEQDLMKIVPKNKWIDFSHLLINFGREFCPARPHKCKNCPLNELCPDIN